MGRLFPRTSALVLLSTWAGAQAATNWTLLSRSFEEDWAKYLPPVPITPLVASNYLVEEQGPFQVLSLNLANTRELEGGEDAVSRAFCGSNSTWDAKHGSWPLDAVRTGPKFTCGVDATCSPNTGDNCRVEEGNPSASGPPGTILMKQKEGTFYARVNPLPAYAMFRFPPVPHASSVTIRYELDGRYQSELYGGNPCANATATYDCSVCVDSDFGAWDRDVPPGFFLLWSATGRSDWLVTGPHLPFDLEEEDNADGGASSSFGILNSPPELALSDTEEIVMLFVVYNQYPGRAETRKFGAPGESAANDNKCTATEARAPAATKDKPFMLKEVTLFTRGPFQPPAEPQPPPPPPLPLSAATTPPRLFGNDSEWFDNTVAPFLNAPCDPSASANKHAGWAAGTGVVNFKSVYEDISLGYQSCDDDEPPLSSAAGHTVDSHWAAAFYLDPAKASSSIRPFERKSALHLLRRLHACHYRGLGKMASWARVTSGGGGGEDQDTKGCQFNLTETVRLREAIIAREMADWGDKATGDGIWWWEYAWLSAGGFDLATSETVESWCLFIDVMRPYLNAQNTTSIEAAMDERIMFFMNTFYGGGWALWNGNNWTPWLCRGAAFWAITFWHEKHDTAVEVLRAVQDVMWLHSAMYSKETGIRLGHSASASVYVEGMSYTDMATSSSLQMGALIRTSFGETPGAIVALKALIEGLPTWQIDSVGTDGYLIPFGDSHRKRGFGTPDVLLAMMAPEILYNETSNNPAQSVGASSSSSSSSDCESPVGTSATERARQARNAGMETRLLQERSCEIRTWFASAYYQSYMHPFELPPELAKNWSFIAESCTTSSSTSTTSTSSGVASSSSLSFSPSRPLGSHTDSMYTGGGYGSLRSPLLPTDAAAFATTTATTTTSGAAGAAAAYEICMQPASSTTTGGGGDDEPGDPEGCLLREAKDISLSSHTPYSKLALQAKSSALSHTEVDFGTLVWTAWGVQLLGEHGYGTIATSIYDVDTRRLAQVDNSPAGHNTLVIRQANTATSVVGTSAEVSFSQFNFVPGTIGFVSQAISNPPVTNIDSNATNEEWDGRIFGRPCVDLDGGPNYGSNRDDGWFSAFHRYSCPLPGGHFLVLDAFATKPNRTPLVLSGGPYGGPAFNEEVEVNDDGGTGSTSTANTFLDVDSYFHTNVVTEPESVDSSSGVGHGETTFQTPANGMCSHVDLNLTSSQHHRHFRRKGSSSSSSSQSSEAEDLVLFTPRCGLGRWRKSDGVAAIAGWARLGGSFVVDGLVSGETTKSGVLHYLRRFRWVGTSPVGPTGDVRAYVLAAAPAPRTSVAAVRKEKQMASSSSSSSSTALPVWNGDPLNPVNANTAAANSSSSSSSSYEPFDYTSLEGNDALLEASVATLEKEKEKEKEEEEQGTGGGDGSSSSSSSEGFPIAWTHTCPVPKTQSALARFGGCCAALLPSPQSHSSSQSSSSSSSFLAAAAAKALDCSCVETCAGGRLYWATFHPTAQSSSSSSSSSGSGVGHHELVLNRVSWAGTCNATHAFRRSALVVFEQEEEGNVDGKESSSSISSSIEAICTITPAPTQTPTPAPTPAVGASLSLSSALVLGGFADSNAFQAASGPQVVAAAVRASLLNSSSSSSSVFAVGGGFTVENVAANPSAKARRLRRLSSPSMRSSSALPVVDTVFFLQSRSLATTLVVSFDVLVTVSNPASSHASSVLDTLTSVLTTKASDGSLDSALTAEAAAAGSSSSFSGSLDTAATLSAVSSSSSVSILAVTTRSPTSEPTQAPHANTNPPLSTPLATTETTTVETDENDGGSSSNSNSLAASLGTVIVAAAAALVLLGAVGYAVFRWRKKRDPSIAGEQSKEDEQIRGGGTEFATVGGGSDEASEVLRLRLAERKAEAEVAAGENGGTSWSSREEPSPLSSRGGIKIDADSAQQQPLFVSSAPSSASSVLRTPPLPLSQRRGQSNKQRTVL